MGLGWVRGYAVFDEVDGVEIGAGKKSMDGRGVGAYVLQSWLLVRQALKL